MRHPERSVVHAQSNAERAVRRDLGLDESTPLCLEENYPSPSVREGSVLVRIQSVAEGFLREEAKRARVVNDSLNGCQSPSVTEPQRDRGTT